MRVFVWKIKGLTFLREMKFFKEYRRYMYMLGQLLPLLPALEFKTFKKILKNCRCCCDHQSHTTPDCTSDCAQHCPVCDEAFFPSLLKEMSGVVGYFNERAQHLVHIHSATGLEKLFLFLKGKKRDRFSLIQECEGLITYAMINATAMRKLLKKYDKIHCSNQGRAFKSEAHRMHIELLQSPWLCELMACYINLRAESVKNGTESVLFKDCSLTFSDGKPALTCEIFDSLHTHVDLKCPICLDTVYDAFALTCGHIFCYMCACSAASVSIVDGLKTATPDKNCPMCREGAVYEGAVPLTELNRLLRRRCPEYWEERFRSERVDRLRLAKEYWDLQARLFLDR